MKKISVDECKAPVENLAVLQVLRRYSDGTGKDFAQKIGVNDDTVNRLFRVSSRDKRYPSISSDIQAKIAKTFGLPTDWLSIEVARLQNERDKQSFEKSVEDAPVREESKPRIINYASAGLRSEELESYGEPMPVIKQLPKYDCTIIIRGDSMEPTYHSGDEVALLNVTRTGFKQWGTPHVLNTSQGIVIKRIYEDREHKGIRCISDNDQYEPFVIPEDEIYGIYKVVGLVRWEG